MGGALEGGGNQGGGIFKKPQICKWGTKKKSPLVGSIFFKGGGVYIGLKGIIGGKKKGR